MQSPVQKRARNYLVFVLALVGGGAALAALAYFVFVAFLLRGDADSVTQAVRQQHGPERATRQAQMQAIAQGTFPGQESDFSPAITDKCNVGKSSEALWGPGVVPCSLSLYYTSTTDLTGNT